MRRWNIKKQDEHLVDTLCRELDCTHFFARILINRGFLNEDDARAFLNTNCSDLLDPFLFNGMDQAVERIKKAIRNSERITVYGDYDVDGITATALLSGVLKELGGVVDFFIPSRFTDGYGVNSSAIQAIAEKGTQLIITVDTGITAVDEVEEAKRLGMDVIVTDHHECQEILPQVLVINPKYAESGYPFQHLAGVGVVFKLISALIYSFGGCPADIDQYTPLAAIGTIADIMPMLGENRYIVQKGLEYLQNTENIGLKKLIDRCMGDRLLDASAVSYVLAPRINAAGRMGNASIGVELLTTDDGERAESLVEELCRENNRRQGIENGILEDAISMIEEDEAEQKRNAIVLWKEGWHNGVVGIVASRLKERYNRPCILFSLSEDHAKGSGRSVKPFNLFNALEQIKDHTLKFGGHAYASGVLVSTDHLNEFRDALCKQVDMFLEENEFDNSIEIDCSLYPQDLSVENILSLQKLAPFGRENESPIFCMRNVRILEAAPTANGNHMRLTFLCDHIKVTAFYFNVSLADFLYTEGETVDVVFETDINVYNGRRSVQLTVKDIRNALSNSNSVWRDVERLNGMNVGEKDIPSRDHTAAVYRYLQKAVSSGSCSFDITTLPDRISQNQEIEISNGAVYLSLLALEELGVLNFEKEGRNIRKLQLNSQTKVDLGDSEILKKYKEKAGELMCV